MTAGGRDRAVVALMAAVRLVVAAALAVVVLPLAGPLLLAVVAGTAAARRWPRQRWTLAAAGLLAGVAAAPAGLWVGAAAAESIAYAWLDRAAGITAAGASAGLGASAASAFGACWLCVALASAALPWDPRGLLGRPGGDVAAGAVRRRAAGLGSAARHPPADGTVLGVDGRGRPVVLSDAQARLMTAVVGASGSGKTNLLELLGASAVRRGAGLLVVDGKGDPELAAHLRAWCGAAGRACKVWSLADPGSAAWDPLAAGTAGERRDKLATALPTSEPFYQMAAEAYLQAVFRVTDALGVRPALADVADLCTPEQLAALASRGGVTPVLREAFDVGRLAADRALRSAVAGLQLRLRLLTAGDAGPLLRRVSGRPLIELGTDLPAGTVVVLSLPRTEPELRRFLGAVALRDVAATLPALRGGSRPVYALYDEASTYLDAGLLEMVARSRDAGLAAVVATQELADYDAVSPALRRQVLGNCSTFIAFRQNSPESARVASETVGSVEAPDLTWQVRRGLLGGAAATGLGSRRAAERPRVPPEAVRTLPVGVAACAMKGADRTWAGVLTVLRAPPAP